MVNAEGGTAGGDRRADGAERARGADWTDCADGAGADEASRRVEVRARAVGAATERTHRDEGSTPC